MFSDAVGSQPPLSRQIASRGALIPEATVPFPSWIGALVGLGCTSAGDLASAGVLAGDLWPPNQLRPLETIEDWMDSWHFELLAQVPHPSPMFVLQRNDSGTPIFSDGENVLGIAYRRNKLQLDKCAPNLEILSVLSRAFIERRGLGVGLATRRW